MRSLMKRCLALFTSLSMLAGSVLAPAQAAMVSSQELLSASAREADLSTVRNYLDREQVRQQLEAWGVAPDLASERVAALDDAELRQLAVSIGEQPAGGDVLGVIGIVFVVLLILELTGVINIFTKI